MDLVRVEYLHWWAFWRCWKICRRKRQWDRSWLAHNGIEWDQDKRQRAHYAALKARYTLKTPCGAATPVSADEAALRRRGTGGLQIQAGAGTHSAALNAEPWQ